MEQRRCTEKDLRQEILDLSEQFPKLPPDDLFLLWFLRAFVTDDEQSASRALCGGPRDKSHDAILIDEPAKIVFFLQGKYREGIGIKNENRQDVLGFSDSVQSVVGDRQAFDQVCEDVSPEVHSRLIEARERLLKRGYAANAFFVTTGRCSRSIEQEAARAF